MGILFDKAKADEWCRDLADHFDLEIWPRPIPVTERLPEKDARVLAYAPRRQAWITLLFEERSGHLVWIDEDNDYPDLLVTHWLPLPPPVEGRGNG